MKCPHAKCWNANSDVVDTQTVKGVHLRRLACLKECDQNVSEDEKDCWVDDDGVETYPDDIRYETDPDDEDEDDDDDDELTRDGAVRTRRYYV
jgi:hypothetical protein